MFIWTIWDVLQGIAILLMVLFMLPLWVNAALREWKCKHRSGFTETSACDAICVRCGKNLGFIGNARDAASSLQTKEKP